MIELTPSEKRAVLLICILVLAASVIQVIRPHQPAPDIENEYAVMDSIFDRRSSTVPVTFDSIPGKKPKNTAAAKHYQDKIDINRASVKDLQTLPRIGPAIAKRITEYREKNGPFTTLNDLTRVRGIGKKTLEKLRPYLKTY